MNHIFHTILLAAVALSSTSITHAASRPCQYADLMPGYQKFAIRTTNLSPEDRSVAFQKQIATRYPDYYAREVFGDATMLQARAIRFFDPVKRAALFPGVQPLSEAHLLAMGSTIGPEFVRQQRRFIQTFADFQCTATVEFGVSLMRFDGHPADIGGKSHLLFGVDVIATLHDAAQMPSFFDHEIFHLYHKQLIAAQLPKGEEPAWVTMWIEGLATYVSQRMNPQLDAQQVLWFPPDMVKRMKTEAPRAAALLQRDIEKSGSEGDRWFLLGTQVEGLPDRAGYYLGYLFAKSIGEGVALPDLARVSLEQVHEKEKAFLADLARQ